MTLPNGLYDELITERLARSLARLDPASADISTLRGGVAEVLTDAITRQLSNLLDEVSGDDTEKAQRQLELVNGLLVMLRQQLDRVSGVPTQPAPTQVVDLVASPLRVLKAVQRDQQFSKPPDIGLAMPWLFTAGKGSPSLLQEIRRELASSDQVDILVSFITVSGVRKLQDVLQQITAKGGLQAPGHTGPRLRILTTTYTGATEARALDELARLPGCEVRVSLDGRRTRLHAKAWLFQRKSGFGSAYVGSANLSGAALTGGLEWTVKLTQRAQEVLFARAVAHFETLWEDSEFQRYDPDNVEHRQALAAALGRESLGGEPTSTLSFFDLQPKTYQQDMLEQLVNERAHGRSRNLLVAATGTGKTVVAAFDYRNTCRVEGGRPRLLFVAHREEILRQAMRTYREVLRDPEFGELLSGNHQPLRRDHLFATIDSLTARDLVATVGADHWHSVVIDECHRLAADRFDAFAKEVRPQVLLGLTATPERSDGQPIAHYFDARPDGGPAVELRLWNALDMQLLAPFEYYACDDATDFSAVEWNKPGEREAIDKLVTGNDVRARLVISEWRRLASDAKRSRTLVFCASVAHAEFMTAWFNRAGLPSACVVGSTPLDERRRAPQRLISGELCALVTVDLYNEGIDLPMVDTLLLLRPTQSPVLFQQQIGRGLRLAPGKESCLVLDFVGHHRTEFRFDRLLSSLTGLTRKALLEGVQNGFGSLPPGCHIHLQRQTREQVLQGLRALTSQNWRRLKVELQTYAALQGRKPLRLVEFLQDQAVELEDVYRSSTGQGRSGWTALKRDAGLFVSEPGPEEDYLSRRLGDLLHVDDPRRIAVMADMGELSNQSLGESIADASGVQMLAYQIDGAHRPAAGPEAFMARLQENPEVASELVELSQVLSARSTLSRTTVAGLEDTPLCLHAAYGVREVLTALGWMTASSRAPFQAGVLPLNDRKIELLFVTLDKSEGYHDRIAYHDYAISAERFHWQTQHSAGSETPGGQRYLQSATNGWQFQLFVRGRKGEAYRACGPVVLESADGNRPISIVWRLQIPLPARLFREFSVLRGI